MGVRARGGRAGSLYAWGDELTPGGCTSRQHPYRAVSRSAMMRRMDSGGARRSRVLRPNAYGLARHGRQTCGSGRATVIAPTITRRRRVGHGRGQPPRGLTAARCGRARRAKRGAARRNHFLHRAVLHAGSRGYARHRGSLDGQQPHGVSNRAITLRTGRRRGQRTTDADQVRCHDQADDLQRESVRLPRERSAAPRGSRRAPS